MKKYSGLQILNEMVPLAQEYGSPLHPAIFFKHLFYIETLMYLFLGNSSERMIKDSVIIVPWGINYPEMHNLLKCFGQKTIHFQITMDVPDMDGSYNGKKIMPFVEETHVKKFIKDYYSQAHTLTNDQLIKIITETDTTPYFFAKKAGEKYTISDKHFRECSAVMLKTMKINNEKKEILDNLENQNSNIIDRIKKRL